LIFVVHKSFPHLSSCRGSIGKLRERIE
jgi:hypothetical protein